MFVSCHIGNKKIIRLETTTNTFLMRKIGKVYKKIHVKMEGIWISISISDSRGHWTWKEIVAVFDVSLI